MPISSRIRSLLCTYIASFSKKQCVLHYHVTSILNVSQLFLILFCKRSTATLYMYIKTLLRVPQLSLPLTDSVRTRGLTTSQTYIYTYLLLRSFSMSAKTFSMCFSSGDMFKSWFSCCTCSGSAAFWTWPRATAVSAIPPKGCRIF